MTFSIASSVSLCEPRGDPFSYSMNLLQLSLLKSLLVGALLFSSSVSAADKPLRLAQGETVRLAQSKPVRQAQAKPNILFIFADDQSYETISALGNKEVKTPNLDRLVDMGTTFTNTYNMGAWN